MSGRKLVEEDKIIEIIVTCRAFAKPPQRRLLWTFAWTQTC